jgi:hypothetical protein
MAKIVPEFGSDQCLSGERRALHDDVAGAAQGGPATEIIAGLAFGVLEGSVSI